MIARLLLGLAFSAAAAPPRGADAEVAPIVELIYDVKLDSAAAAAERLVAEHPGDPAGPFYRSLVAYQRSLLEERRSKATLAAFEADMLAAQERAQAWISSDPARGYYYLGASEGFHSRYLVAEKRFFKAVPEGTRAIKHLRRALELDPSLEDAYLGVGMYHYFRTRIPTAAKPFAFIFFGESGNRELGLSELERVMDKGDLARTEARSILATIYSSDGEELWDKAVPLFRELMQRYPNNPIYRLRAIFGAEHLGNWDEAAALASDESWLGGLPEPERSNARALALYRAAEAWALGGHPEKVEKTLDQIEAGAMTESLVDWVLLRRANVYDWKGNRLGADRLYDAIKDPEAARAAKGYQRSRYPNGPQAIKPLTGLEFPY